MSLNWDVTNVEDWETLQADDLERVITDAVVWQAITVDLGGITADNVEEWVARTSIVEALHGPMMITADGPRPLTAADIHRRIGLKVNVAPLSEAKWTKKIMSNAMDARRRTARRHLEEI